VCVCVCVSVDEKRLINIYLFMLLGTREQKVTIILFLG
jgi:hypothetical protein